MSIILFLICCSFIKTITISSSVWSRKKHFTPWDTFLSYTSYTTCFGHYFPIHIRVHPVPHPMTPVPVCRCELQMTESSSVSWSPWQYPADEQRRRSCCSGPGLTWLCTRQGRERTAERKEFSSSSGIHSSCGAHWTTVSHLWGQRVQVLWTGLRIAKGNPICLTLLHKSVPSTVHTGFEVIPAPFWASFRASLWHLVTSLNPGHRICFSRWPYSHCR